MKITLLAPARAAFALLLAALAGCAQLPAASETHGQSAAAAPKRQGDHFVLLIGVDGLRADAIDRFPDAAPNLRALASHGVRASMVPVMPSITFVNFYALATGLYAEHTGIVSNSSYSRSLGRVMARADHKASEWWGGEPIWVTAEKQGVKTATMFWLGSEAAIGGVRPTYWFPYDHQKPFPERTAQVLSWLARPEAERPRFASIYFHAVDSAEHMYGVGSPEERDAIAIVDAEVGALVAGVAKLGLADRTDIIVVADHGMANVLAGNIVNLDDYIAFDRVLIPEFEGPDGAGMEALVHIFVENGDVDSVYNRLVAAPAPAHFKAYRREHLPERWRLNNPDRTGDIVVVADEGWLLWGSKLVPKHEGGPPKGEHGYDRHLPAMQATFIADGPDFADGVTAEPFDNVEVYGMIADILGVVPAKTDGDLHRVAYIMTPAEPEITYFTPDGAEAEFVIESTTKF